MRHGIRNALLTAGYLHPVAIWLGVRRGPRALKNYLSEMYRCSKTDGALHLPTVAVEELFPKAVELRAWRPKDAFGSLTGSELIALCHIVASIQPRKMLEIGTFRGDTTLNLALNAPLAEIHTLDLPETADPAATHFVNNDEMVIRRRGGLAFSGREEGRRIRQHRGDSATFDFSAVGAGVDFCLIDAAHSYEYVRSDTAKALPLLTEGAILLWHDYGRNDFLAPAQDQWGVSKFLHELAPAGLQIIKGTSFGYLSYSGAASARLRAAVGL